MQALHLPSNPGITYFACWGADGKTFTHTAFFQSEAHQKILFALPTFQRFQSQLRARQPEVPPQQALLTLVGAAGSQFS